jgi:hypothetical protein
MQRHGRVFRSISDIGSEQVKRTALSCVLHERALFERDLIVVIAEMTIMNSSPISVCSVLREHRIGCPHQRTFEIESTTFSCGVLDEGAAG